MTPTGAATDAAGTNSAACTDKTEVHCINVDRGSGSHGPHAASKSMVESPCCVPSPSPRTLLWASGVCGPVPRGAEMWGGLKGRWKRGIVLLVLVGHGLSGGVIMRLYVLSGGVDE